MRDCSTAAAAASPLVNAVFPSQLNTFEPNRRGATDDDQLPRATHSFSQSVSRSVSQAGRQSGCRAVGGSSWWHSLGRSTAALQSH